MLGSSQSDLPVAVVVRSTDDVHSPIEGELDVRFRRAAAAESGTWQAVITVHAAEPLDPEYVLARAHDYCVEDDEGLMGVVDDVRPGERSGEGTLLVVGGLFGRRRLTVSFRDVEEIRPSERRLILRSGHGATQSAR